MLKQQLTKFEPHAVDKGRPDASWQVFVYWCINATQNLKCEHKDSFNISLVLAQDCNVYSGLALVVRTAEAIPSQYVHSLERYQASVYSHSATQL